jgi:hypothetical protein
MERKVFEEIMGGNGSVKDMSMDDNAFLGLQIIRKYCPTKGIQGADHDVIYSVGVDELIEAGITEEDAHNLRNLNWMIEDGEILACFV